VYLFVDTEANGIPLDPDAFAADVENWPRLVQIAWSLTDKDCNELRTQVFIIRPEGFEIPARIERSRGITTETALSLGADIRAVLKAFAKDLTDADALVAHNVSHDERLVRSEFYRAGRRMNPFVGKRLYCTMRSATGLCKLAGGPRGYKWPTLEELHQFLFNTGFESPHDAAADVRACVRCFKELKRRGTIGDQDLFEEIYRLADSCEWFHTSQFVDSVYSQFEERGFITMPQRDALNGIRQMLLRNGGGKAVSARAVYAVK